VNYRRSQKRLPMQESISIMCMEQQEQAGLRSVYLKPRIIGRLSGRYISNTKKSVSRVSFAL
jgi:hypothetical protein